MDYILPKVKKYVEAICKPYFIANQQNIDIYIQRIKTEIKEEYEARIAALEDQVEELSN